MGSIDVVRIVFAGLDVIIISLFLYQMWIEKYFTMISVIHRYLTRFVLISAVLQFVTISTHVWYGYQYSDAVFLIAELTYDFCTLAAYGCYMFIVGVTVQNASQAAQVVGSNDTIDSDRIRIMLIVAFSYLSIACIVSEIFKSLENWVSYCVIYQIALITSMVFIATMISVFIFKLWRHLNSISSSTSSAVSVLDRVRPFVYFVMVLVACGIAAAVIQILKVIGYFKNFRAVINIFYSDNRANEFDSFAPILLVGYSLALWYLWKWPSAGDAPGVQKPAASPSVRRQGSDKSRFLSSSPASTSGMSTPNLPAHDSFTLDVKDNVDSSAAI